MSRLVPPALVAVCTVMASCSREQGPPRDARAEAAASAAQRLQGRWLLQSFQPAQQLDFALQTLLAAQIGQLVVEVNGLNMFIRGAGVAVQRTYRVDEAYGEHLQLMVFDRYGVGFRAVGDFQGNSLAFAGTEAPWAGRGTLVRVP
jgi:predicted small secreted protein